MAQSAIAAIPALKDTFAQLKTRMEKAVETFRTDLTGMRTGRASVHMLDTIHVDAYGSQMPLNQVANVHAPEPNMITVTPWDNSLIGAIEKSIRTSDLGFNPMNAGRSGSSKAGREAMTRPTKSFFDDIIRANPRSRAVVRPSSSLPATWPFSIRIATSASSP